MLVAAAFLAVSVPRYLTLDPALSRLEPPEGNHLYYPLLVAHVLFGTVAMVTACFQIWPRFRRLHRRGHRLTGRIYVLGGALPGGLTGLYIGWHTPFGPSARVANLVVAALWLTVTIIGFRMARQRRYAEHRTWMTRSFALTMSIVMSRVLVTVAVISLTPQVNSQFGGSEELMLQSATSIGVWSSLVAAWLLAEWTIERGGRAPKNRRPSTGSDPVPSTA